MDEKQIIKGCRRSDPRAQKAFVDAHSRYLYGICRRYMGDSAMAHDALQESLVKILMNMDKYDGKGNFKSWITTVTIRKNLELIRYEKVRWTANMETSPEPSYASDAQLKLEHQEVLDYVDGLPTRYRVALNMFMVEGYSHKEIAEELSISEGTSRSLVSRGRQMIQRAFEEPKPTRSPKLRIA